ncbi:MAG: alpha/beta hydrolase, partial [Acidimicrobiales bacterium]|nr:alpha/beta hydrolase [Acidimicrobiales bacterium]
RTHAVLYLHGGAYTVGSLNTHRALGGRLAIATGVAVVTLDYRLAPEHPFPAAVEDAASALAELVGRFGADHVAIAGDSAGGGLAVATVLLARGRGQALPAAVATISPWADLTHTHETHTTKADVDPWVATEVLDVSAADYLAGAEATDPLASPVFADLAGLPPLRIDVGDREVLLGDSLVLAERARAAGVAVDLHEWPEMIHVFPAFPGELVPEADAAVAAIGAFLRGHLA